MKVKIACITLAICLLFSAACVAGPVTLSWTLSASDSQLGAKGGYHIYQGISTGVYSPVAVATVASGVSTVTFTVNTLGTYFWVATAFDSSGDESGYSNEVSASVKPESPTSLTITNNK